MRTLVIFVLLPLLGACASLVTERIDDATGLTRAERCLEYRVTLVRYEAATEALGGGPERRQRIETLRALADAACMDVEE
jgi:hypothetical protein